MQYILTEQELKQGCELLEAWREHDLSILEVHNKSKELNKQGWFTIINCTDCCKGLYEIIVLCKNVYN